MITEDYVSFETAKLLKLKGFEVSTQNVYYQFDDSYVDMREYFFALPNRENGKNEWACPTLQLTMKWLREVHHIGIESLIVFNDENDGRPQFMCQYWSLVPPFDLKVDEAIESRCFDTYEESIETAIKYCLENLI